MKRSAFVGVMLFALVASGQSAAAPEIAEPDAGIVRLLRDVGSAFVEHDRTAYVRTLEPGPWADQRVQRFDAAATIGFAAYTFEVTTQFSGALVSPRVRDRYRGREVRAYHVLERSRVAGMEDTPFVEDSFFTFVRDGPDPSDPYRGWRLVSDADFVPLGLHSAGHIWDAGAVEVVRGDRFVALSHADVASEARAIVAMADDAYDVVQAFWPRTLDERFVIIVPSTTAELARMLRSTFDLSKFVAFAVAGADRSDGWEPGTARIFVHLQRFRRHQDSFKRETMGHELIHAITRPLSGPFIPVWVEEGLASLGSGEDPDLGAARSGPTPSAFPADDEFSVGPTSEIVRTYRRSQVAMTLLHERSGADGLAAFYEALGAERVAPGTTTFHLQRAAASVGWSLDAWRRAWRERLD